MLYPGLAFSLPSMCVCHDEYTRETLMNHGPENHCNPNSPPRACKKDRRRKSDAAATIFCTFPQVKQRTGIIILVGSRSGLNTVFTSSGLNRSNAKRLPPLRGFEGDKMFGVCMCERVILLGFARSIFHP